MKAKYVALLFFAIFFVSCQKHGPTQVPAPQEHADTVLLKLKDMVINGLPSPYYHFNYNDSGYISRVDFSSGLSIYDLTYTGVKLSEMDMNKDVPFDTRKDKLEFDYTNGDVTAIRITDKTGFFYRKCLFTYSADHQLQQMEWDVNLDSSRFLKEEVIQFNYYADGNLSKMAYRSFAVGPQTATAYEDLFENYDSKPNADAFSLLHLLPNFVDLILLPSVRVQLNNPGRITHTGDGINYKIEYSYSYDTNGRPSEKRGDFIYIGGGDDGKHVNLLTTFSYYD